MKQKFKYVPSPAILQTVVPQDQTQFISISGLKPSVRNPFGNHCFKTNKLTLAVTKNSLEKLKIFASSQDIQNPVIVTFITPFYYKCTEETPETTEEYEFLNEFRGLHVNMCIVTEKIKPKYIREIRPLVEEEEQMENTGDEYDE